MDELKEKEIEIYTEKAINKVIETDKEMVRTAKQREREIKKEKSINCTEQHSIYLYIYIVFIHDKMYPYQLCSRQMRPQKVVAMHAH